MTDALAYVDLPLVIHYWRVTKRVVKRLFAKQPAQRPYAIIGSAEALIRAQERRGGTKTAADAAFSGGAYADCAVAALRPALRSELTKA